MRIIIGVFLLFCTVVAGLTDLAKAQQHDESEVITQLVTDRLGRSIDLTDIVGIDSATNKVNYYYPLPEDPYNTLAGCSLFGGVRTGDDEVGFVGVFKNGRILWMSDTLLHAAVISFWTSIDINNDGKVELLFEENGSSGRSQLWVFSWDGASGMLISALDEVGNSVIQGSPKAFELVDEEGDGIWEITDGNVDDGSATWSWNGLLYGDWSTTPHLPLTTNWPRDKIDADVRCTVMSDSLHLSFNYSLSSRSTSHQRIEEFDVWNYFGVAGVITPIHWVGKFLPDRSRVHFDAALFDSRGQIRPGHSQSGYRVIAAPGPCAIVRYTILGYNNLANIPSNVDTLTYSLNLLETYSNSNAIGGSTIATIPPTDPFVASVFIDTLESYVSHARLIGWIKDQPTADKYVDYFNSTKTSLEQGNNTPALTNLQQVLQQVNVDSTAKLTSEAYALIRFNTEYLLAHLPSQPPGLLVKLENSSGTLLTSGSLQYYEGSWKDAVNNGDGTFCGEHDTEYREPTNDLCLRHANEVEYNSWCSAGDLSNDKCTGETPRQQRRPA